MSQHLDFKGKWGTEVRKCYKLKSIQSVDGTELAPEDMRIRSMNFGQHWRTEGVENFPYEAKIPLAFVIDYLNTQLEEYVEDAIADPDEDDEMDNLLKAYGWSTDAENLLSNTSERLKDLLMDFFAFDMLIHWYCDGQAPDNGAMINSFERFSIDGDYLIITGQCRKSGFPVRYQDI
ncbi:hypothetical protein [Roseivirga sp. E12]|uniref:hypothetical protein n=1 Tax=Roseivirga sp. E12 TaxID=2819237 RepID=UPI001ABC05BF|nr:hypothetical protein [Roseivirga sp. E12]MBO3697630.1 hypothetical protein [Roseivirga sp. E12]